MSCAIGRDAMSVMLGITAGLVALSFGPAPAP